LEGSEELRVETGSVEKRDGEQERAFDYREVASCACFHVRRAARLVTQEYDAALAPLGLKATQYTVLCALAGKWPAPPSVVVLSEHLLVEPSALSRNVAGLVKRGLIQVAAGRDRRERGLSLTAEGKGLFREGFPRWQKAQHSLRARLGDTAFAATLKTLGELTAACQAKE